MQAFEYSAAARVDDALAALAGGARCLAGGTNLVDLMKGDVERPARVVDINRLPLADVTELPDGGLRIGALVRNSDLANHPRVRRDYPLLSEALLAGASPQLRNMASVGGNLLQRTRCGYFTDTAFPSCNKRVPGSGCAAREGYQRMHAILGASPACIAVAPSDMNVALAALDAVVVVQSLRGERRIAIGDFHRLPGDDPARDTVLEGDELIVAVLLPRPPFTRRAHYLKVRDRASYAFALVSAAVGLDVADGRIRTARVVLGGVAHKPWRAGGVEQALQGAAFDAASFVRAAQHAADGAEPLPGNAYKVELAQRVVARALDIAAGRA